MQPCCCSTASMWGEDSCPPQSWEGWFFFHLSSHMTAEDRMQRKSPPTPTTTVSGSPERVGWSPFMGWSPFILVVIAHAMPPPPSGAALWTLLALHSLTTKGLLTAHSPGLSSGSLSADDPSEDYEDPDLTFTRTPCLSTVSDQVT